MKTISRLLLLLSLTTITTGCGASQSDVIRVSLGAARALCRLLPEDTSSGSELFSAPAPDHERAHVEVHRDGAVSLVADDDASVQ